jgi:hypothetical protein
MAKDQSGEQVTGHLNSGITAKNTLVLRTIDFVIEQLPAWRDDKDRPVELSEDKLNLQLCKFLNARARNIFPMVSFNHEEYQMGRRSIDLSASLTESSLIGVKLYTIYNSILVFECKRLPAPSKDREMEYITGGRKQKSGGIQRLKMGLHGADFNIMAMIGYVQKWSFDYWFEKINHWILELASGAIPDFCLWESFELLEYFEKDISKGVSNCRSIHNRMSGISNDLIQIHHLWVLMNKDNTSNNI